MALVYGVTLVESMVKDYLRYLMTNKTLPATTLSSEKEMGGDAAPRWWHEDQGLNDLRLKVWKTQIQNWCESVLDQDGVEFSDKKRQSQVTKAIRNSASFFDHWRVLVVSIAIRNCIIHSDGLMNAVQHRRTPLCPIDEEPHWDTGLIYDVFSALDLLNNQFSTLAVD